MAESIVFEWEPVTESGMRALAHATRSTSISGMPPTFPTVFRHGEFEYLKELGIDLRNLLHTEQEYEYKAPLMPGVKPVVTTRLKSERRRAGMLFLTFESSVTSGDREAVVITTSFLVREKREEER